MLKAAHRGLRIEIEFTERLQVAVEKLEPERRGGLHRKDIEDAAAPCKLLAGVDLGNLLEAGCEKRLFEGFGIVHAAHLETHEGLGEFHGCRGGVGKGVG